MKKIHIIVFINLLTLGISALGQQVTANGVKIPKSYLAETDVIYKEARGWEGRIDIYFDSTTSESLPLVLYVHGGGWNHGEKESRKSFSGYFKRGFAVVNVEYRLSDVATAPAAVEDVRCALLYMITHADYYNIDVNRIVLEGTSAGAHLALMAGLVEDNKSFTRKCDFNADVKVAAIIDKYGIADLTGSVTGEWNYRSVKIWLDYGQNSLKFAKSVSPLYQVTPNSPPVFIVHGNADPIVPYQQSIALYNKLKEAGVKTEFMTVPSGEHGKFTDEYNNKLDDAIYKFLKELNLY